MISSVASSSSFTFIASVRSLRGFILVSVRPSLMLLRSWSYWSYKKSITRIGVSYCAAPHRRTCSGCAVESIHLPRLDLKIFGLGSVGCRDRNFVDWYCFSEARRALRDHPQMTKHFWQVSQPFPFSPPLMLWRLWMVSRVSVDLEICQRIWWNVTTRRLVCTARDGYCLFHCYSSSRWTRLSRSLLVVCSGLLVCSITFVLPLKPLWSLLERHETPLKHPLKSNALKCLEHL